MFCVLVTSTLLFGIGCGKPKVSVEELCGPERITDARGRRACAEATLAAFIDATERGDHAEVIRLLSSDYVDTEAMQDAPVKRMQMAARWLRDYKYQADHETYVIFRARPGQTFNEQRLFVIFTDEGARVIM